MVKLLTQIIGVGIETADKLVHEILSRRLRDRRVVARYGALLARLTRAASEDERRALYAVMPEPGEG
jgi:transposase